MVVTYPRSGTTLLPVGQKGGESPAPEEIVGILGLHFLSLPALMVTHLCIHSMGVCVCVQIVDP